MSDRMSRLSRKYRVRRRRSLPLPDVAGELAVDLPDEDLAEDLDEALDLYVLGSKPRCEEAEYLELVEEAIERIAWGD
ncbi:hypothetical protein ACWGJ2_16340 [Streptomyces sp. NPDC054796]